MRWLSLVLFCCLIGLSFRAAGENIFREAGAAYLEDITGKEHFVFIREPVPIYFEANFKRYLGTLRPGQRLELQAIADKAVRVKGKAKQGQVSGWILRSDVENLGEEFVENVQKAYARYTKVKRMIENKQVALGMTQEEVALSLGKPTNTRRRVDPQGTREVWEFVQYDRILRPTGAYDDFGKPIYVFETIAVSTVAVVFDNDAAIAVEETRDNVTRPRSVSNISAPVVF